MCYIEWNKKAFCIAVFWMILSSNFNHFCRVKKSKPQYKGYAQWAFLARNGMEKAQKSTVFYTYFYNGNF